MFLKMVGIGVELNFFTMYVELLMFSPTFAKKRFENHMKCLLIKDDKDYIQTMNFYIYGGK